MSNDLVQDIIDTAIQSASESKYCRNCEFSYFTGFLDKGYCKYGHQCTIMPKVIDEFAVCKRWKKKLIIKKE